MDKRFLTRKSRADRVISANRPKIKVAVDRANPITVRNWKCEPYASLLDPYQHELFFFVVSAVDKTPLTPDSDSHAYWTALALMPVSFLPA